jgi:glycosyltransferase involved in cell wall biosynthesis
VRVLLLSRYGRLGSSSRVRFYQYLPYLSARGVEVTAAPLLDDGWLRDLYAGRPRDWPAVGAAYLRRLSRLVRSRRFDLAWVEKELFPWAPAWGEAVLSRRIPLVADYDDASFHTYDRHPSRILSSLMGGKIDAVMRRSFLVVAGNGYIAERARRAGAPRVEILPSVIDLDRYPPAPDPRNGLPTVGWIGSPPTARHLKTVESAVREVVAGGKARIAVVGAPDNPFPGLPVRLPPWSEETEVAEIRSFDIGIMPLPDEPWERGKCGYKLIQYMGCGLPVVASPVGVNREIVADGASGFLASGHDEWVAALSRLANNATLRQEMGSKGRGVVASRFSLQVTAPRLLELLHIAAGRTGRALRAGAAISAG